MKQPASDWLRDYRLRAAATDQFDGRADHRQLLIAGLIGEAGGIAAEAKKMGRDGAAYPAYLNKLREECGDFLWYLVRYGDVVGTEQSNDPNGDEAGGEAGLLDLSLDLCASVAGLDRAGAGDDQIDLIKRIWRTFERIVPSTGTTLPEIANLNLAKIQSRWPTAPAFHPLFDEEFPVEEQLPRTLAIDFVESTLGDAKAVTLRYQGIGIGDRITDNIADPDGYRFHDVFHMANAVYLGWSPVLRSLLRCKRKSRPEFDRDQDGARAAIIEEAVSAVVFRRAKEMNYFREVNHLDYDLLKTIQEMVSGFEVDAVPVWQWERGILEGYGVFEKALSHGGGRVSWSLPDRALVFTPPEGIAR